MNPCGSSLIRDIHTCWFTASGAVNRSEVWVAFDFLDVRATAAIAASGTAEVWVAFDFFVVRATAAIAASGTADVCFFVVGPTGSSETRLVFRELVMARMAI